MGAHRCQAVTPSDLATVLIALDATVELSGRAGRRSLAIADLYTGPGETILRDGEVLARVRVPSAATGKAASFEKLRMWGGDFALTSVALATDVDGRGVWRDVRLCVGGISPVPWQATGAAAALEGRSPSARDVERALHAELSRHAHPLPGNAWKLEATVALAGRAAARLG
jgi:CO/xanthine dehydrogenase FAD-binding subunit